MSDSQLTQTKELKRDRNRYWRRRKEDVETNKENFYIKRNVHTKWVRDVPTEWVRERKIQINKEFFLFFNGPFPASFSLLLSFQYSWQKTNKCPI